MGETYITAGVGSKRDAGCITGVGEGARTESALNVLLLTCPAADGSGF